MAQNGPRQVRLKPCHFRAIDTELINRARCHLPQANCIELRWWVDSIPSALTTRPEGLNSQSFRIKRERIGWP
jgi:hypothetical protein